MYNRLSLSLSFGLCCTFGTKEGAAPSRAAALLLPTDEDDDDAPLEHMLVLLCGQRSGGNQTMPANPEVYCVCHATYFLVCRPREPRQLGAIHKVRRQNFRDF